MLRPIASEDWPAARPLFPGVDLELTFDAALAGHCPAEVWADDPADPAAAVMWDRGHLTMLGGSPTPAVAEAARALVKDLLAQAPPYAMVRYAPAAWEPLLPGIYAPMAVSIRPRVVYVAPPGWRAPETPPLPDGFGVEPLDRTLIERARPADREDLLEEVRSCWVSLERFLEHGFGACVVHGDEIVTRCTAEYLSPGKVGIGIATKPEFERRGFGTAAAVAVVRQAQDRGLTAHWSAWARNLPSVAVARKAGLALACRYEAAFGRMD